MTTRESKWLSQLNTASTLLRMVLDTIVLLHNHF